MGKENIKNAFSKVKADMDFLKQEISLLKEQLLELYELLNQLNNQKFGQQINSTHLRHISDTSTDKYSSESLKTSNLVISTGNGGVSTDRQTDIRQTDTQNFNEDLSKNRQKDNQDYLNNVTKNIDKNMDKDPDKISKLLASLDSLKKEIRRKFKRLTNQEMKVFSALYQLESQGGLVDYKILAEKLRLSQSSIRDYISRMIEKGIPITKNKINNKKIILKLVDNIKQIASLDTIIKLREL